MNSAAQSLKKALDDLNADEAAYLKQTALARRSIEDALSALGAAPTGSPRRPSPAGRGASRRTNAVVLTEIIGAREPDGALVSEVLDVLVEQEHRLARAADPLKAVSNELAELKRKGLCYKDDATKRYHVIPSTNAS